MPPEFAPDFEQIKIRSERLLAEIRKVIVGQDVIVRKI